MPPLPHRHGLRQLILEELEPRVMLSGTPLAAGETNPDAMSADNEPAYGWTAGIGGGADDYARAVVTDGDGTIFVAGRYAGTVDFDPNGGTDIHTAEGGTDIFVTRLNADGSYAWTATMGGSGDDVAYGLARLPDGRLAVTGAFRDTVDFDPNGGVDEHTAQGGSDVFVTVLNPDGSTGWTATMGGSDHDVGYGVAADSAGHVTLAGSFGDTVDFDPTVGADLRTAAGGSDLFVTQLDADGAYRWTTTMGGANHDIAYALTTDAGGDVVVAGTFRSIVDFDPGPGTDARGSHGGSDLFVTRLTQAGAYDWTRTIGGPDHDIAYAVTTDLTHNIVVTGSFQGSVDFDPNGGTDARVALGGDDIFVTQLSDDGAYRWTVAMGGTSNEFGYAVATDDFGRVVLTGSFYGSVDFDPTAGTDIHASAGSQDLFVTHLDPDGSYDWTTTVGGGGWDAGFGVTVSADGQLVAAGGFQDTADFDPTADIDLITANGGVDLFVTRWDIGAVDQAGPRVTTHTPIGVHAGPIDHLDLVFNEDLDADTFATDDVTIAGPDGAIAPTAVTHLDGTIWRVTFDPQSAYGDYTVAVGPGIADLAGNGMDQDQDGLTGEAGDDIYHASFEIAPLSDTFVWACGFGGSADDEVRDLAADAAGTVYAVGRFAGTVDFNPGDGTDLHTAHGGTDAFLTRLNADGSYAWTLTLGNSGDDEAWGVATDSAGHVYLAGAFEGTVDFDPGSGIDRHSASGLADAFVACFADTGAYEWMAAFGGAGDDAARDIAVDGNGSLVAGGVFRETVDFDPGIGTDEWTSAGGDDAFVVRLSPDGTSDWSVAFGGSGWDAALAVAADGDGRAFATGYFEGDVDFDPGDGTDLRGSVGLSDAFLVAFNPDGTHAWSATAGGDGSDRGEALAADTAGHVLVAGRFMNAVDFDPTGDTDLHTSVGSRDAFVSRYLAAGTYEWTRAVGSSGWDEATGIATNAAGEVFVAGLFEGTIDLDPSLAVDPFDSTGSRDAFVLVLTPTGDYREAMTFGGAGRDEVHALAADGRGYVLTGGFFNDTVDFDPTAGTDVLTANGQADAFVTQLQLGTRDETGPRVLGHTPFGTQGEPVDHVDVTFDEAIDASTFSVADVTLTGPTGAISPASITPVTGTTWRVGFAEQTDLGAYEICIGPDIADPSGNLLDQDQDGVGGEIGDDVYVGTFNLDFDAVGPRIVAHDPSGVQAAPVSHVNVTFGETIDVATFDVSDVSIDGPAGAVAATNVIHVAGDTYRVTFAAQSEPGAYTVTVGPQIADLAGNLMDQDEDGTHGEPVDDTYTATFEIEADPGDVTGPRVISHSPTSAQDPPIASVTVTFNEAIDVTTFDVSDVAIDGPAGAVAVTDVSHVAGNVFSLGFAAQSEPGAYTVTVGPQVADLAGNLMDQDQDGIQGEPAADRYAATFEIAADETAPWITGHSPAGSTPAPVESVAVTFSEAIAPATFTTADVAIAGPAGAIAPTGVQATGETTFSLSCAAQSEPGTYEATIGPNMTDLGGNPLDQDRDGTAGEAVEDRYVATFEIPTPAPPPPPPPSPGTPATAVVTANAPLHFTDGDGDDITVALTGSGEIALTFTGEIIDGSDITEAVVSGTGVGTALAFLTDGAGNGVQVGDLQTTTRFARLDVDGDVAFLTVWGSLTGTAAIDGDLAGGSITRDLRGTLRVGSLTGPLSIGDDIEGSLVVLGDATGVVSVHDDLKGAFEVRGAMTGGLVVGDDVRWGAEVWVSGGGAMQIDIGDVCRGSVFVAGAGAVVEFDAGRLSASGRLEVPDGSLDAHVTGRLQGLIRADDLDLTVGARVTRTASITALSSLGRLDVGGTFGGTLVVFGDAGAMTVGWDIAGPVTIAGDLTGPVTIGDDIQAPMSVGGDVGRPGAPVTFDVGDDIRDRLDVGGSIHGLLRVGDDVRSNGSVLVGGALEALTVGGSLAGSLTVGGDVGPIAVGWDIAGPVTIDGSLTGMVSIGDDLQAPMTVAQDVAGAMFRIGDDLKASLRVGGAFLGDLVVGDDLRGMIDVGGSFIGDLTVGDDVRGGAGLRVDGAMASTIDVTGYYAGATVVAGPGATVTFAAGRVTARGRIDVPDGTLDATVVGDVAGAVWAGRLSLTAGGAVTPDASLLAYEGLEGLAVGRDFRGALHVFGDADAITIGDDLGGLIDIDGALTGAFSVTDDVFARGRLRIDGGLQSTASLVFGDRVRGNIVLGEVFAGASIFVEGGLAANLIVNGDFFGVLDVRDNAEALIDINGDVYGDITIGGRLNAFESHSSAIAGIEPVDYIFLVLGQEAGTLCVDGDIQSVSQA